MSRKIDHAPTTRDPAGLADADVNRLRDSMRTSPDDDTFANRFTLIGEAGTGGMGIVYEAIDRESGRRVAIKVITGLPSLADRQRFAAETEMLEHLDHHAIVDYVCHGVTNSDEPYLVMEWLVGESLTTRLARGPLAIAQAVVLGERIADALDHAHRAGIVHRDLKPSNIFLVDGEPEQAHVIDFGVAKRANSDLTATGQMIGTPGYMAPEQVRGDKNVTESADLFALGCVLYKAMTGKAAFEGTEIMEVLARLLLEHPQAVEELAEGVPPRLAHLVGSLLSKDGTRRLRDAAIVRDELRAIREALVANDTTALALKPASVPAAPRIQEVPIERPRLRWPLYAGGAAIAAAVVVVVAMTMMQREREPPPAAATKPVCSDAIRTGCKPLCAANDADACYLLARTLHKNDLGIPVDHEAARVADQQACELGHDDACIGLAMSLLRSGKTFPRGDERRTRREAEAVGLLMRGCDHGFMKACQRLGFEYSQGFGQLDPDPARAFALVEQACSGGLADACKALRDMVSDAANGATPELRAHAREVLATACKRGVLPCT